MCRCSARQDTRGWTQTSSRCLADHGAVQRDACPPVLLVLEVLEDAGRTHPAADAHGDHAIARSPAPHLTHELDRELRPRRPHRVAERYGTAVDVGLLEVKPDLPDHRQRLRRERLVELDQVYLFEREPGELEHPGDGDRGPYSHYLGPHPADGEPDEAGERREAALLGLLALHHHDRSRPVAPLRGVAGRHRAPLLEDGRKFSELLQRGITRSLVTPEGRLRVADLSPLVHPVELDIEG